MDHLLLLVLGQLCRRGNRDLVLLTGPKVLRSHIQNSIRIYVEGDIDLWNPPWCGRDSRQVEFPKRKVVLCHRTLSLEDVDCYGRLEVRCCGEHLAELCGNGCVSLHDLR